MKEIILRKNGELQARDLEYFGGKYSFLERVRIGGIGSPKVIYKGGVPYFDELDKALESEIPFANFEIMKNGFLIRLNHNQRLRYVGFQLHEVLRIKLIASTLQEEAMSLRNNKLSKVGKLFVQTIDQEISFEISAIHFQKVLDYFGKPVFREKFELISRHNPSSPSGENQDAK